MVSWLVCSTPERVVWVWVLAGDIALCSAPRCINRYLQNAGGNPAMDLHPIQRGVKNTPRSLVLRKPGISTGVLGHWLRKRLPTLPTAACVLKFAHSMHTLGISIL